MAHNNDLGSSAFPGGLFKSIRTKLIVYFCLLFTIVLVLVGIFNTFGIPFSTYAGRQGEQREEAFQSLSLVADLKQERLLRWIEERRDDAHMISDNDLIRTSVSQLLQIANEHLASQPSNSNLAAFEQEDNYQSLLDFFKAIIASHEVYDTIYLADAQTGTILVSTDQADIGQNIRHQPFFTGVLENGHVFISDIKINPRSQHPYLNLSHTIRNEQDEVMAVLIMEINTNDILLPILHTGEGLGQEGEALLVNRDGIILNSLKHPLADGTQARPLEYQITAEPAVRAANGQEGVIEALDYRGEPVLAAYRHFEISSEGGWGMVVKRDRAELFAPLRRDFLYTSVIAVVGLLTVIGFTIVVASNLTWPLRSLSGAASKVAEGDLEARAPVTTPDEVGHLAVTFNHMVQRVQNWQAELEAQVKARTTELYDSEERFRLIVQNMPILINAYDQHGLFAFWNRECERITGYKTDEIVGNPDAMKLLYPDRAYLEQIMTEWTARGDAFSNWEMTLTSKDGIPKTIAWSNISGECPVPGWHTWAVGVDITQRQQAEQALEQSRRRYQLLFDSMLDGYALHELICDQSGAPIDYRFLDINPAFERLTGLSRDLVGKTVLEALPGIERHWIDTYGQVVLTGQPIKFENYAETVGRKWFEVVAFSPTANQFVTVFRDVTERKRVEKERKRLNRELMDKNRELEQIVYVTSHDLRSPLVNIQGFSRELNHAFKRVAAIIERDNLPADIRAQLQPILEEDIPESLQYIFTSTARMDALLSGLLRLSRLGRVALEIEKLDMNKIIADLTDTFEFRLQQANVALDVANLPPCLGDEGQISQVFANLLDNALKYLDPSRPGIIKVSGCKQGDQAIYCIEDNGIGIAAEHQPKIYEIFHRLNPSQSNGEGLGLTIVHRILDRHHGSIWVESELGQGSKFFVALPFS
jgi:PAS domain S-box-containing protein